MGNVARRIEALEARERARALSRIKDLCDDLTDREVMSAALHAASRHGGQELPARGSVEREGSEVERRMKASGIEGLLRLAVRPEECASEEEIDRRIRVVTDAAILADGRRARIVAVWQEHRKEGA